MNGPVLRHSVLLIHILHLTSVLTNSLIKKSDSASRNLFITWTFLADGVLRHLLQILHSTGHVRKIWSSRCLSSTERKWTSPTEISKKKWPWSTVPTSKSCLKAMLKAESLLSRFRLTTLLRISIGRAKTLSSCSAWLHGTGYRISKISLIRNWSRTWFAPCAAASSWTWENSWSAATAFSALQNKPAL